jgi:hypothetical protein
MLVVKEILALCWWRLAGYAGMCMFDRLQNPEGKVMRASLWYHVGLFHW